MKKLTLLACAAMIVASLSSCKKDYTCTYSVTVNGQTTSATVTVPDATRKDIKELEDAGYKCDAQ